jgi:hypothetical protein
MCDDRGAGRGCKWWFDAELDGEAGAILKASFGSPIFVPAGSRASPERETQPRFMPPACGEWILKAAFWWVGRAKKDFDYNVVIIVLG